nr:TRAP transporter fused permease subunit [uncultured Oscillibacter sp.]
MTNQPAPEQKLKGLTWADYLFYAAALLFVVYQMYYVKAIPYVAARHSVVHLGFAMAVCALAGLRKNEHGAAGKIYSVVVLAASAIVTVFLFLSYGEIVKNPSYPAAWVLVCGVAAAIISIFLVRKAYGWLFPIFAAASFLYVLYGKFLPGVFHTGNTSLRRAVTLLAADITSPWGVYGSLLQTSANYLFLFIIFGSALSAFGSLRFIVQLGNIVASRLKSGPAALAVITSALMGSITGSTVANITVTGAFTIPMMKKSGYKPAMAAAIEAAASNGGQFLPPVMGATVFVMAAYTGIPYLSIAKAAVIPAVIYYFMLLLYAEMNARKLHMEKTAFEVDVRTLLLDAPQFVVPLGLLMALLFKGYSLMTVVFWTFLSVVVLGLASTLRKDVNLDWKQVLEELGDGVLTGANIAVLMSVIGIFVAAMEITGLTLKLGIFFNALAGGSLFLLLLFTMIVCILMGCAVPTPAAYVICATVMSPSLTQLGVPLLTAHLFPMFFAFLSHLTPPVGIGLLVACKLSGAKYLEGAAEVWKAAFPSLVFPFIFVYSPAILLDYASVLELVFTILGTCLMLFCTAVIFNREWKAKLSVIEIAGLAAAVLFSAYYLFLHRLNACVVISLLFCAAAITLNMRRMVKVPEV